LPIGLTVGRGPLGQWLRDAQKSVLGGDATAPTLPNRPGELISRTSTPPAPELEESRSVSSSGQSVTDSDNSSGESKLNDVTPSEEKPGESARNSASFAKVPPTVSNSVPAIESKPSVLPGANPGRGGSAGLIARVAPLPASPKPAHSLKAAGPVSGSPRMSAPRRVPPAAGAPLRRSPSSAILVTAPAYGNKPFRVTLPGKPIAASSSFAMTSELSVLVPPQPGPAATYKSSLLQAGELAYFVWPRFPRQGDRYGSAETIRVRATVGQLGQVLDIRLLSGSASLLPATRNAIRLWRYKPTLLDKRPVPVQQDITIEFRPPQYLSRVRTQHPSHN